MKPRVVCDANVLFPASLRDVVMHLATNNVIEARWTNQIHEEWIRNLARIRPDLTRRKLEDVRALMDENAQDSLVEGYESLIPGLRLPDPDDRHVVAAAIFCGAGFILTFNLKDFPQAVLQLYGIKAQAPDEFFSWLLENNAQAVCAALKEQREQLKKPPRTVAEHLAILQAQGLANFVAALDPFQNQL